MGSGAINHHVSIHARHYWRASLVLLVRLDNHCAFQSTPAITGERAMVARAGVFAARLFQSTPAITGERALDDGSMWIT